MVMWIVIGAFAFKGAVTLSGAGNIITNALIGLPGQWLPIIITLVLFMIIGMFMEVGVISMITAPFLFPAIRLLGFNDIWFGCLIIIAKLTGNLSPPFGWNLFYMKAVCPDIDPSITTLDIYRSIIPYIVALVVGMIFVMIFPPIATWLPTLVLSKR